MNKLGRIGGAGKLWNNLPELFLNSKNSNYFELLSKLSFIKEIKAMQLYFTLYFSPNFDSYCILGGFNENWR